MNNDNKTPEEIDRLELLAASYACDYRDSPNKTNGIPDSYLVYSIAYDAFLDGYKAAMDQVADADKVMNSPKKLDSWISVKKRLPVFRQYNQNDESGYTEDVLMCFVWGRIRINNFEKVDGIVTTGCGNNLKEVTHWMPLPEAPKEEK